MGMSLRAGIGCVTLLFVACAAPMSIHYDRNVKVDFQSYVTFAWVGPAPLVRARQGSDSKSFVSPLDDQRIRGAVNRLLEARGYRFVNAIDEADLVVAYSVGSEEKVRVRETPMVAPVYPYPARYQYGSWYSGSTVRVHQYSEGSLSLEFYDAKTEEAVWVGWASKRLSRRDDSVELISEAIGKILARFPRRPRAEGTPADSVVPAPSS